MGRIVRAVPAARVLCVYLRGDAQQTWSDLPARGEPGVAFDHAGEQFADQPQQHAAIM